LCAIVLCRARAGLISPRCVRTQMDQSGRTYDMDGKKVTLSIVEREARPLPAVTPIAAPCV